MRDSDREIVKSYLERIMSDVLHDWSPEYHLHTTLSNYSSSFASYIISLKVAENREYTIFMKDYSDVRSPVQQLHDRRTRELYVYKEILGEGKLGTAKYYGSIWDESNEKYWLFLEFVDGRPLKEKGFEYWLAAVRWLGQLYAYSNQNSSYLKQCNFLEKHNTKFFQKTADAAQRTVAMFSLRLADQLSSILINYPILIREMVNQPPVLVHGSYRGTQILINDSSYPYRVCPVDWETAALGASIFDLSYLADGFASSNQDEIINVYRDQTSKYDISIPTKDDIKNLINCYCFHRTMKWLSNSWADKYSQQMVEKLVTRAEHLAQQLI